MIANRTLRTSSHSFATRLGDAERQNRIAKGICFRCNEKFGPEHQYKTGALSLLEITNADEESSHEDANPEIDSDDGAQAD